MKELQPQTRAAHQVLPSDYDVAKPRPRESESKILLTASAQFAIGFALLGLALWGCIAIVKFMWIHS
jgi:hypothetical protein